MQWQPSTTIPQLRQRALVLEQIRDFFRDRNLLEVDTPIMSHCGVSDPHIDSIPVAYTPDGAASSQTMWLMSSPEYAMKRLLAAGSGSIFQIAKAFRNGEAGRRHNPEFTLLEWYRVGFDLESLMQEVAALVDRVLEPKLGLLQWHYWSYREAFARVLKLDPHAATDAELRACALAHVDIHMDDATPRDTWFDLLMSHCIEPVLPPACFIYDYPASQAALARLGVDEQGAAIARRFEVYINGVELANGYQELTNAKEQKQRFWADNQARQVLHKTPMSADQRLIEALHSGLPDCSGVALGIERLLMLALGEADIASVMAFNHPRA
jgi:lysyl-tRNA synthetase class 2